MSHKAYPQYHTTGIDWLGDVPQHWRLKRFKFAVDRVEKKTEVNEGDTVLYIGLEHIESWTGTLLPLNPDLVPSGMVNVFASGNTLFGKLRPYLAKASNVDFNGVCSTELLVLNGKEINRRLLLYFLLSDGFIKIVDSSTFGSKMPRANWEFIGSTPLPIPPTDEQIQIADFLDREIGRIDLLVGKKRGLAERLKEKRSALISRTVTRGLPPDAARAVGLPDSPPLKASGFDWIGEIPTHWDIVPYKRLCTRVDVGIAEAATHAYCDDGVPIIRSKNVRPNRLDTSDVLRIEPWFAEKNRSKTLRAGDLVTVRTGYPGTTAIIPTELDGSQCFTLVLSTPKKTTHGPFYSWVLNSRPGASYFEMEGWGTAQTNISVPIVQFMPVPRPPFAEQVAIAGYLAMETEKLDKLIASVESAIERLQEYRAALINAAVTGKIDVRKAIA